jgi:hypothetical protein
LYHPITGDVIPENAPLDGLTWEMLAFLRWAVGFGQLSWHDEVTIAREAKIAGSIYKLPVDRFYAKNSLPMIGSMSRRTDENIDWTDVGLAEAKQFVTSGPHADLTTREEPPVYVDDDLAGVLSSIPALRDSDARDHLLRGLPPGPAGSIRRNGAPATDLHNIVEAVTGWGEMVDGRVARNVLIENALKCVRGFPNTERKLKEFKV